jgi:PPM family protein phosphatase
MSPAAGVRVLVSALTDVGRARSTNEDAFAVMDLASGSELRAERTSSAIPVQDRGVLLALSDGMGGHQAGEVASALVLESLQRALRDVTAAPIHEQLEQGVRVANKHVKAAARIRSRHEMGATLTAVLVHGGEAYVAEVGDSRAYLLRQGRLRQITRDQSLVQMLIDRGMLTAEEARQSPQRSIILQAVGLLDDVRVAIGRLDLRWGDRLLLCSDGVSGAIADDELRSILEGSDPRAACETMIALANARGGHDNQTAIVADVFGDGLDQPAEFETVTSTYQVLKAFEATIDGRPVTEREAQDVALVISGRAPTEQPAGAAAVADAKAAWDDGDDAEIELDAPWEGQATPIEPIRATTRPGRQRAARVGDAVPVEVTDAGDQTGQVTRTARRDRLTIALAGLACVAVALTLWLVH